MIRVSKSANHIDDGIRKSELKINVHICRHMSNSLDVIEPDYH